MKEEKRNKITAAITVNAVLFVFILVAILIAQIVQISVLNRRKQDLLSRYNILVEKRDEAETLEEKLEAEEEYADWFFQYVDVWGKDDPLDIIPDGVIIK